MDVNTVSTIFTITSIIIVIVENYFNTAFIQKHHIFPFPHPKSSLNAMFLIDPQSRMAFWIFYVITSLGAIICLLAFL